MEWEKKVNQYQWNITQDITIKVLPYKAKNPNKKQQKKPNFLALSVGTECQS